MTTDLITPVAKAAPEPPPSQKGSVQSQPRFDQFPYVPGQSWVMNIASIADTFTPWGQSVRKRDAELRAFWPTEPHLASAVALICTRNAMQTIELDGPPRTVAAVQEMFDDCEQGQGIDELFKKFSLDAYTQDNGAFMELVGREKRTDPVTSLNHLDSAQCRRTGRPEEPVVYYDPLTGEQHRLAWYQVIYWSDFPTSVQTMYGVGYCFVTRVLRGAQIIRDLSIMDAEKVGGRFTRKIHLVSGVPQSVIEDRLKLHMESGDNRGLARYINHMVLGSLDPTATPTVATIDLASEPESFDRKDLMEQYINLIAMGAQEDYQTFAPLPGGNLGTSQQSKTLDAKSKGKGPKAFTKFIVKSFRQQRVVPMSVQMGFEERDAIAEKEQADVESVRAATRAARIVSGEITVQVARNIAQDDGDLDPEYMPLLEAADANADITVNDEEDASSVNEDVNDAADGKRPVAVTQAVQVQSQQAAAEQQRVDVARGKAIEEAVQEVRDARQLLEVVAASSKEIAPAPPPIVFPDTFRLDLSNLQLGDTHIHTPPATVQAANIVNQNVLPAMPEQKDMPAPLINVDVHVPQGAAPMVQVDNVVNVPRLVAEHTAVLRDAERNMLGTEKTFEYDEGGQQ